MIRLILIFVLLAFTPVRSIAQSADFNSQKEKGLKSTVSILEDKSGVKALEGILAIEACIRIKILKWLRFNKLTLISIP